MSSNTETSPVAPDFWSDGRAEMAHLAENIDDAVQEIGYALERVIDAAGVGGPLAGRVWTEAEVSWREWLSEIQHSFDGLDGAQASFSRALERLDEEQQEKALEAAADELG